MNNSTTRQVNILTILATSMISVILSSALIIVFFLPALYGFDPTGLGAKLGINAKTIAYVSTDIGQSSQTTKQPASSPSKTAETTMTGNNAGNAYPAAIPPVSESISNLPETFSKSLAFTIPAKQSLAFNFAMERDYEIDYHWATDGKPLYCELRGLKKDSKDNQYKVFGKLKETKGRGFFIAPFNGKFSLNWENKSEQEVKLKITAKGIYQIINPSDNATPK